MDIENTPLLGYTFGLWETNVLKTIEDWYMLCFSYKWLDEKKTHVLALPDFRGYEKNKKDDKKLVEALWKLFDEADIIIAHNGQAFDIKKANVRFAYHKMKPPSAYQVIDTKLVAKKYFKFDSNKLTELGRFLGLGVKEETGGIDLWFDCMAGEKKAWAKMTSYNIQDVVLLEKIYLELRPWMTNHPNIALMDGQCDCCPNCGGHRLIKKGFVYTRTNTYQGYKCLDCHARPKSPLREGSQIR